MKQLHCYGITRRALHLLAPGASTPPRVLPDGWFNWLNPNIGTDSGRAVQRLTMLDPDAGDQAVLQWSREAGRAGYGRVLIYSMEDPPLHTDGVVGLDGAVVLHPLDLDAADSEETGELLDLLREPEEFFQIRWDAVTWGGGVDVDRGELAQVPMAHWWAYGAGLREWVARTADGRSDAACRRKCADYSIWNRFRALGFDRPDIKLDTRRCWDSAQEGAWPWDLMHPCTPSNLPGMGHGDVIAYYPMRQMPCCGLALHKGGRLSTVGALPDERGADGAWVWDDGLLQKIMLGTAKPARPARLEGMIDRLKAIVAETGWVAGVPKLAPSLQGVASSELPRRSVAIHHGFDEVHVSYDGLRITLDPTRRAGPSATEPLWLTAFAAVDGELKVVGQWSLANRIAETPFQLASDQIAFIVSEAPYQEK